MAKITERFGAARNMVLVPLDKLRPGMVLASAPILPTTEAALLVKGTVLDERLIARVSRFSYLKGVFVTDESMPPVELSTKPVLTEKVREQTLENLKGVFQAALLDSTAAGVVQIASLSNLMSEIISSVKLAKDVMVNINDLKAYDDYTYHHSLSVAVIATAIGIEMHFTDFELKMLGLAALLHDIGKIQIPVAILNKPARLTDHEFEIIKLHPSLGIKYLSAHNLLDGHIYAGIAMHHERVDGGGYPLHKAGDDIPLFARIISVADVYDALTSKRPYRNAMQPFEAVEYMMGACSSQFDWNVLRAFITKIELYPTGSYVRLSNGRYYQVTDSVHNLRPVVRDVLVPQFTIDLNERQYFNLVVTDTYDVLPEATSQIVRV